MHLAAEGHPLHSRALSVILAQRADGRLDVRGSIVDLRKRGFIPIAGDLQSSGLIHDMRLNGIVDPDDAVLAQLDAEQRSVAFEPCAATEGESCRDPIGRVATLAGVRLDADWSRRLAEQIGGPRGCSHLLTLAHLLGAATAWALPRIRATGTRRAGERVFQRDVVIDGHEPVAGRVQLVAQLTELHLAPAPPLAMPMARFGGAHEVRVLLDAVWPGLTVGTLAAAERVRGPADLADAVWEDRAPVLDWLPGALLGPGTTAQLLTRLDAGPLRDTMLMLAPTLIQCAAALSEGWAVAAHTAPTLIGMSGLPDSCYMWRRAGALIRAHEAEGGRVPRRR